MSKAEVAMLLQSLNELPDGAGYSARSDRATVNVVRNGDSIRVTGECDSLARQCIYYEQERYSQRIRADSLETEVNRLDSLLRYIQETSGNDLKSATSRASPSKTPYYILTFVAGAVVGSVLTNKIKQLWKIIKTSSTV
jgi:hypothetical protein